MKRRKRCKHCNQLVFMQQNMILKNKHVVDITETCPNCDCEQSEPVYDDSDDYFAKGDNRLQL